MLRACRALCVFISFSPSPTLSLCASDCLWAAQEAEVEWVMGGEGSPPYTHLPVSQLTFLTAFQGYRWQLGDFVNVGLPPGTPPPAAVSIPAPAGPAKGKKKGKGKTKPTTGARLIVWLRCVASALVCG